MATSTPRLDAEQVVRESFRVIFEERDLSDPGRFWTDASVNHFLALGIDVRGKDALAGFFAGLLAAAPDWRLDVEDVVATEDRAAVRWHATGTFTGAPWYGIEPTGRSVDLRGCDVIRLTPDGKVVDNTIYYDGATFARQIGMLPAQGSRGDRAMLAAFNARTRTWRRVRRRRRGRAIAPR